MGWGAWTGLMSRKSAPLSAVIAARSARSTASPMPHEACERVEYICAPTPHARLPPRSVEGGAADEAVVDGAGRDVAVELLAVAVAPVLEDPLDRHPRAVGHVDGELVAPSLAGDDRGGQGLAPLALIHEPRGLAQVADRRFRGHGDAKRAEDLEEGLCADVDPVPVPVPVAGGHSIAVRDVSQEAEI